MYERRVPTQTGGGPHHGVESGGDAVRARTAPVLEDDPVVVVVGHLLHSNPYNPPGDGSNCHAGNEETRRDLERRQKRFKTLTGATKSIRSVK